MELTPNAKILYAVADKIRDDSELHDAGHQPEKRFAEVLRRLDGIVAFANKFKEEITPKPKPKKKVARRKK